MLNSRTEKSGREEYVRRSWFGTAIGLALFIAQPVLAQDSFAKYGMFILPDDMPDTIMLVEDITIAASADFFRALRARPEASRLVLISGGGSVYGALSIAFQVHERGMTTIVPAEGWCYSACAYIYFAGATRELPGELGVHQISTEGEISLSGAQTTIADILDALETFDVDPGILSVMFRTAPDDIHVFSADEVERFGIERSPEAGIAAVPPNLPPPTATPDRAPTPAAPSPAAIEMPSEVPSISPHGEDPIPLGVPENVTIVSRNSADQSLGRTERLLTAIEPIALERVLKNNSFTENMVAAIESALAGMNFMDMGVMPRGAQVRILFGPSRSSNSLIPYRLSIYLPVAGGMQHQATVALTDKGQYVLAIEPYFGSDGVNQADELGKQDRAMAKP